MNRSWHREQEAPKRYESPPDCKNLSVFPRMQSQIAFVPKNPPVSVAEFDDESICLFVRIEIAVRRQIAKCLSRLITRDFKPIPDARPNAER
jgi:hypothetical protein